MSAGITSEINVLKKVIVHTPGHEVSLVNPNHKEELLFDDIIFEDDARAEHLEMLKVFKAAMPDDGEILEVIDLAKFCFENEDVRHEFIEMMIRELPSDNIHTVQDELKALPADKLLQFVVEGSLPPKREFNINPAPNLLFTRDLSAVVGDSIILSRAAKHARVREFLMMEMIVKHHPLFDKLRNNIIHIGGQQSIEGGDVLVASDKLVLIGMSERTSFSGLMNVAEQLLAGSVEHVLAVDIPKQRSSMHLDTIFTFADRGECVVFPPAIEEQTDNVVHLYGDNGEVKTRRLDSLKSALEELTETPFTFIQCGGPERINQFREQWTDGANVFALAPGVIVGYERNTRTFQALREHGYRLMDQFSFVEEFADKPFDASAEGKIAIHFQGHELCRGRGGARCMTLPVLRDNH